MSNDTGFYHLCILKSRFHFLFFSFVHTVIRAQNNRSMTLPTPNNIYTKLAKMMCQKLIIPALFSTEILFWGISSIYYKDSVEWEKGKPKRETSLRS